MSDYRIISSDNHVIEPEDLWTSRMSAKFKDRAPHLERGENSDSWVCDGLWISGAGGSGKMGARFEDPERMMGGGRIGAEPSGRLPSGRAREGPGPGRDGHRPYSIQRWA